jgi:raffinose/stachyose/melibiose transport system substrate-binding protein
MGSDQVAFWPIGNYIYPNIIDINPIAEVGLMPYPMGDEDSAVGNKDIVLSYSMFAIDAKQSTKAQQDAAVDFFNWLITSEEGQDSYINTLVFVPIFEGFKVQPSNPVAKQIVAYMEEGNTLERMSDYFPAGVMNQFGATMQQYLDGKIQRADVAEQFKKQWVEFSNK